MKYIGLAFQYMKRRFGYTLLYGLLPAIIFTLTSKPVSIFNTIVKLANTKGLHFMDVWLGSTELGRLWGVFYLILSALMLIIFASAFCGVMERDMRLGDLTHKKFFTRINNNFLIILKVFLVFVLFLEVFGVANAALIYLWYRVFERVELFITMAVISLVIGTILAILIMSLGILWVPTMIMTGLNMRKSLVESLRLIKGRVFKTTLAILLPAIPFYAIVMISNYCSFLWPSAGMTWLNFFTEFLLHMFVIGYYLILMFVIYFDATGTDREDLKKKIWEVGK